MAAFEQKPGTGSMFRNKDKKEDKHPDGRGTANIDGTLYELAGWRKKDKNGDPYYFFVFKEKSEDEPGSGSGEDESF